LSRVLLELGEVERGVWLAQDLLRKHGGDRLVRAKLQLVLADATLLNADSLSALRHYKESLEAALDTRSVPALLLRLARLANVLMLCDEIKLAQRLLTYCSTPKNYRRTSFVDRQGLPVENSVATFDDWQNLEPDAVAVLVISDVNYLLHHKVQGESSPALL
jgi:hypothetical protein